MKEDWEENSGECHFYILKGLDHRRVQYFKKLF